MLESISGTYAFEAAGEAPMPGRWCGRGGFYAGQVARPGCPQDDSLVPPMSRKRGWASQYSLGKPVLVGQAIKRGWASQYYVLIGRTRTHWANPYSLGEPVLIGRTRTHWANPYSLGEPVLIGQRANPYSLGEPVLIGRTRTHWASQTTFTVAHNACACLALCLLGTSTLGTFTSVPARHIYKCLLLKCLLGTPRCLLSTFTQVPARHVYLSACSALCLLGTVPARHVYLGACSALCLLGTVPARHRPASRPPRSSPGCPTYGSLTGKKQGGHFGFGVEPHAHVKPCEKPTCQNDMFKIMSCKKQAVPRVMQKHKLFHMSCKKTSCSTCHAMQKTACKTVQKSKLFHMSCKNHAKTMQKP